MAKENENKKDRPAESVVKQPEEEIKIEIKVEKQDPKPNLEE